MRVQALRNLNTVLNILLVSGGVYCMEMWRWMHFGLACRPCWLFPSYICFDVVYTQLHSKRILPILQGHRHRYLHRKGGRQIFLPCILPRKSARYHSDTCWRRAMRILNLFPQPLEALLWLHQLQLL